MATNHINAFLGLLLSALPAFAEDVSLLHCKANGPLWSFCQLDSVVLAEPIRYEQDFETTYSITYSFPCSGHSLNLGFANPNGKYFSRAKQNAVGQNLKIDLAETLRAYDPEPIKTARLSFFPNCKLLAHEIQRMPSAHTIARWRERLFDFATRIELLSTMITLMQNLTHHQDLTEQQFDMLKASLAENSAYYASVADENSEFATVADDFQRLHAAVSAMTQYASLVKEQGPLLAIYQLSLEKEKASALAYKKRFLDWGIKG